MTTPPSSPTFATSLEDLAKELGKIASRRVKHDKDRATNAATETLNSSLDLSTLTIQVQEPLSIPKSIFELRLPSPDLTILYDATIPMDFGTSEAVLTQNLYNVVGFFGKRLLFLAGIPETVAQFSVDLEISKNDRICIGTMVLKTPAIVTQQDFFKMDEQIDGACPTNDIPRDRVLRRVCYSLDSRFGYTSLAAPPFRFSTARLIKTGRGPKCTALKFCQNNCLPLPRSTGPIHVAEHINEADHWTAFYEGVLTFVLYGLLNAYPVFKEAFGEVYRQCGLQHEVNTLFIAVRTFFVFTIDAPAYATRYLHLVLNPDRILLRSAAEVFIYEALGFVVKTFTNPEEYRNEMSVYSTFSGRPGFPTLLASGESPPFILITYVGISPSELSPSQL
ncbi:hypothetical protein EST38_g10145 [Candolleomyces aberdarensis]|uniref:Uncharacterized protein n=1 Tax=Candolleomyces aberdarensis TaxID=2316362 RepID=A0A4Q2D8T6_9AGAR|nr:hypothetical protein EST38_g10145 [Candolleomyces aberdarensis]